MQEVPFGEPQRGPGGRPLSIEVQEKGGRTVRRLALLLAGSAIWLFLLAIPALADNGPHIAGNFGKTPDQCASCHRAHSAVAANLLVKAQPGLCYQCHGSTGLGAGTDVQDGTFYGSPATQHVAATAASGALRGGGFDYALISSNTYTGSGFGGLTIAANGRIGGGTPEQTTSHHSVIGSPVTMWGNGPLGSPNGGKANVDLTCGSCHDPHGDHTFRILKPGPSDSGIDNYSFEANYSAGGRVYVNDTSSSPSYTTTNYGSIDPGNTSASNGIPSTQPATQYNGDGWNGGPQNSSIIAYNTATKNWYGNWTSVSSQWCATCHTRYLAPTGSAGVNSGDAVFTYRHAIYGLIDPSAPGNVPGTIGTVSTWLTTTGTTTVGTIDGSTLSHGPRCLLCHISHGSNATMTSVITSQTSPGINQGGTPNLTSTLLRLDNRGVCQACHNK